VQEADNALAQSQVSIDLNKQLMSQMAELKNIYGVPASFN
jgi:hypothetical protein